MIGVFGLYRADGQAPADPSPLAATVAGRFTVDSQTGAGAALGFVAHPRGGGARAASPDGRRVAVASGRIYNLDEFADPGVEATNEAELILHLAESGTLDRLERVNGQFCAAHYDADRHYLTLITDRLATFPVHYWRGGGEVVFASQIHTLLGDPRAPRRADTRAIAQLFAMQRTIGTVTPVAGVAALPAACILEIGADGVRERRYWRLEWRRPDFDQAEGAGLLADALGRAVARQSAFGRCGLLLSGGIDSRMVLAAADETPMPCWTTASYEDNPELALARRAAELFGAEHHALIVEPAETFDVLDDTVIESNGLYPASTPMSAFLPAVGENCDVIFTGHGLDYTLRGYYLPARFLELAGSRTRLPALRPVPARPTGADVLNNLRQGPPRKTVERIVRADRRREWWEELAGAMQAVLEPWLTSDEPYNAWDAFILHAVSKHYAFTGMMAARAVADLAMPAFDNEVFGIYLRMPPSWRCGGRMAQLAMRRLSPEAAKIPNANSHFRADLHPWIETAVLLGRGALRRIGLARPGEVPSPSHSRGSWQNTAALYREEPRLRQRFIDIKGRLDALALGVLDADGLAACIDEHLDGRASHTKLLRQLLTHDAWMRTFGIEGHA